MSDAQLRPPPQPVRINARAVALTGTGCWLLALIALLLARAAGAETTSWSWVCAAGVAIGAVWSLVPTPRFTGVSGQDSFDEAYGGARPATE